MSTTARRYFDADSHVLEPTDWLTPYADPGIRDRMRTLTSAIAPDRSRAAAIVADRSKEPDPTALDDARLWGKGYQAFGAWDGAERIAVLDKYGIDAQFVFSTFAPGQFLSDDLTLLYGGVRAHTRALTDFARPTRGCCPFR